MGSGNIFLSISSTWVGSELVIALHRKLTILGGSFTAHSCFNNPFLIIPTLEWHARYHNIGFKLQYIFSEVKLKIFYVVLNLAIDQIKLVKLGTFYESRTWPKLESCLNH